MQLLLTAPFASVLMLIVTGCGDESLSARDPNGYDACTSFVRSWTSGDAEVKLNEMLASGQAAVKASTTEIRAAVEELEGIAEFPLIDSKAMHAACSDNGFDIPDEPTKTD
jgi:hypothetical protein